MRSFGECVTILTMITLRPFLLIIIVLFFSGCFWSTPKNVLTPKAAFGIPTGQIINREAFLKGGTLVVLPFKAGEDAMANPQLDRVALMLAKGVIDYLDEQRTPYQVLTTQDQGRPQMIIDGYIHDFNRPGRISRWIFRNKQTRLRISGQMVLSDGKERVMVFQADKSLADPKRDGLDVAYQTGQDLGRFIVDALNDD